MDRHYFVIHRCSERPCQTHVHYVLYVATQAIRTSLEAALARAARWTQRGSLYAHAEPEPEIARLAGSDADPHRSPALQNWRIIGSTDSGIDGAVARWESAATAAVSSLRTVTQLALQLTSADIALLCASTSAILRGAIQAGAVPDAPAVAAALDDAGRSWREAARWPRKFRLGGRALDLRHASADLRQCLDESLRTGSGWKHSSALFAQTSPEHLVAVAHSGLQSATRVGQHVLAALQELTYGSSRIWRDARQTPMPAASSHSGLDGLRYEWRPDSVGSNSAKELHDQTSRAMTRLTHATLLTTEVCLSHTRRPEQISDDEGPWETVSPPLEPLRSAQERATRAAIAPSDPPAHTLGL